MSMKQLLRERARAFFLPKRPGAPLSSRQRAAMRFYLTAGETRAQAAPGDVGPEMAAVSVSLLRDAAVCLLRAVHHSRHPDAELVVGAPPLSALEPLLDEPGVRPDSDDGLRLVRTALGVTDCTAFDLMSADDLQRLQMSLEPLVSALRARIDLRTDAYFRSLGVARVAIVSLLVIYGFARLSSRLLRPENVAFGRPVQMSSRHPGTPDPSELVDGVVGGTYGAHTQVGGPAPPWIVVDLQRPRNIHRIIVYNRGDQNLDACLPYSVSVSEDGRTYQQIARRETHFGSGDFLSSPWTIKRTVRARFVRVEAHDYIALSELEVFE